MQVFKHYFEELEEESLRDNFVVVVSILSLDNDDVIISIMKLVPALAVMVVFFSTYAVRKKVQWMFVLV
jgi:hypothetical protein